MKPLALALMAAVALATAAPAASAAAPAQPGATAGQSVSAHYTGKAHTHYTKKKRAYGSGVYLYRGRWYRAPRAPRKVAPAWNANAATQSYDAWHTKATWTPNGVPHAAHKGNNKHDYVLPEAKPNYSSAGKYIPTTFIYQQTNGEFKILKPAETTPVTTGTGTRPNPAAPGAGRPSGRPPNPPTPPNPPGAAAAAGAAGTSAPAGSDGGAAPVGNPVLPAGSGSTITAPPRR